MKFFIGLASGFLAALFLAGHMPGAIAGLLGGALSILIWESKK